MARTDTTAFPQADRLQTLRGVVRLVAEGRASKSAAKTRLGLSDRHWGYYLRAAVALGLVGEIGKTRRVTDAGTRLLETGVATPEERSVWLDAMRASPALAPFVPFVEGAERPTEAEIVAELHKTMSPSTADRRAGTLRRWRKQLASIESLSPRAAPQRRVARQLSLAPAPRWPQAARFPYNSRSRRVREILVPDLESTEAALIITGYGSLDVLISVLGRETPPPPGVVRVAFGVEPFPEVSSAQLGGGSVADEVRDYWFERGISVSLCVAVLRVLALLDRNRLVVRLSPTHEHRLHAKVYVTDRVAMLGSSNFSRGGLERLLEANARFERKAERARYEEAVLLAEALWESAEPYAGFRELLESLLRPVSWREALARACAELLEGDWAERAGWRGLASSTLWPSQRIGIARALWVLEEVGSVLIADATGSGKTKMAAYLLRALRNRLFARGQVADHERVDPMIASPPGVMETWRDELVEQGLLIEPVSHGRLSRPRHARFGRLKSVLSRTQILAIDEGHRFLNRASNRTAAIVGTLADHVLVFTATPVSRSGHDLVGIVDLLGADNLEPEALQILEQLWRRRARVVDLDAGQLQALRRELRRFTVRRTRRVLNGLIDQQPDAYRNALGVRCRYPDLRTHLYTLDEPAADRELSQRVGSAASRLKGVSLLHKTPIRLTQDLRSAGWTDEQFIRARVAGAAALAKYQVRASLRSSRAALWEHLNGTVAAREKFGLVGHVKSGETGDVVGRLREALIDGVPVPQPMADLVPVWLRDPGAYADALRGELEAYEEIEAALAAMSDTREQRKVAQLRSLLERGRATIAFDSRPITLALIRGELAKTMPKARVLFAVGGEQSARDRVASTFALGGPVERGVALCSDAMSEGLNLQAGSVLMHLDMPSTVRQAEQRVGRILRMDSPHASVDVYWPKDADEFALSTDERFVQRVVLVERLLGGNLDLPTALRESRPVRVDDFARDVEDHGESADLDDAFAPVASLVEGPSALVDRDTYKRVCTSRVRVVACVSVVRSRTPWVFAAVRAAGSGAPRWALVREGAATPEHDMERIAAALRELLEPGASDDAFDDDAGNRLTAALAVLTEHERLLLPAKKRRALDEMMWTLEAYKKLAKDDAPRIELLDRLCAYVEPADGERLVDLRDVADAWLRAIHGRWREQLQSREGRGRPMLLRHLRRTLVGRPLTSDELVDAFRPVRADRPLGERVVAAIVGRPGVR